MKKIFTVW